MVAENLPDEQVHGLKQMFDDMDKDKNGSLTFEELKDGLCTIGEQPLADPDVQMLMEAVSTTFDSYNSPKSYSLQSSYLIEG